MLAVLLTVVLLILLPANGSCEAADDVSTACTPNIHAGDSDVAIAGILEVIQ